MNQKLVSSVVPQNGQSFFWREYSPVEKIFLFVKVEHAEFNLHMLRVMLKIIREIIKIV
jgi:hypothetical protein